MSLIVESKLAYLELTLLTLHSMTSDAIAGGNDYEIRALFLLIDETAQQIKQIKDDQLNGRGLCW